MRFKGLDLNLLVALDVLLAERSVTQAAARLHLTQSAMSGALARLRGTLNDELLVQSGRKMVLTPFAEELRDQVRQILTLVDSTMRSNPGFRPETSQRHFRIAASDFVNEVVMVPVQREVHRTAPGISLDLLPVISDEVFAQLHRGEMDLVIAPPEYCDPGNSQAELFSDSWVCIAWAENAAVGPTMSREQYLAMDHVVLQPYGRSVALDEQHLSAMGLERRVKVTAPVFTLIPQLVVGTDRIATVPARLPEIHRYARFLKSSKLLFDIPPLTETMQWHPSRERDMGLAWLRQLVHAVAQPGAGGDAVARAGRTPRKGSSRGRRLRVSQAEPVQRG